jgi:radical SAM superfamily enzyme YgiQ (UPF0313 family)
MDVVLINPPLDKKTTSKFVMSGPPVGIAFLAAYLRQHNIQVALIDAVVERLSYEEIADYLKRTKPLIVGVSCLTENRYASVELLKEAKKQLPDILTILGGIHPSFTDEIMLKNYPFVDLVCRGEGEETLLEIVRKVKARQSWKEVLGISYLKDGQVVRNSNREFIADLDSLPFPAYDLLSMEKYPEPPDLKISGAKSCVITTSRGCPMGCRFCATTKYWGSVLRASSVQYLFDQVQWLNKEFGVNYIRFVDDLFTLNRIRVLEFCRLAVERKLGIKFRIQARVDTIDDEVLRNLKKAGCDFIEYGAESGSNRVLSEVGKRINVEKIKKAAWLTRKHGIGFKFFLIVGLAGEREEDTIQTFKLIKETSPDWVGINPLAVYPGTYIEQIARQKGIVNDDTWLTYVNPRVGNAPLFADYYSDKEMIFLSQLGKVWSMKCSPARSEYRLIEKIIGFPLSLGLIKWIIREKTIRRLLANTSALLSPILS